MLYTLRVIISLKIAVRTELSKGKEIRKVLTEVVTSVVSHGVGGMEMKD